MIPSLFSRAAAAAALPRAEVLLPLWGAGGQIRNLRYSRLKSALHL